jgi:Uma2 family endonuclease
MNMLATKDAPLDVPPLEPGDHLTSVEFERRWNAMPKLKKAELIKGVVYMPSPVGIRHGDSHAMLLLFLGYYASRTSLVVFSSDATTRLDEENVPQPDAHLRLKPAFGGRTRVEDGFLRGAPELVAEVAMTSASIDLHDKKEIYELHGALEYIV